MSAEACYFKIRVDVGEIASYLRYLHNWFTGRLAYDRFVAACESGKASYARYLARVEAGRDRNNCEIGRWCKVEHAKFVLFNR